MIDIAEAEAAGYMPLTFERLARHTMRGQWGTMDYLTWCCLEALRLEGHLRTEVVYRQDRSGMDRVAIWYSSVPRRRT